jgi:hypothetical protein
MWHLGFSPQLNPTSCGFLGAILTKRYGSHAEGPGLSLAGIKVRKQHGSQCSRQWH